jgi:RNA polymerase sigma factor (sigma-70 family)
MTEGVLALRLQPDVLAAAHGDQRAFGRLVDGTSNVVASIALAILRDAEASADVAQDVYLSVWTDLRKLREPASFLPWLRQLTRNRAHHALRTHVRRRQRIFSGDRADPLLSAASDPRPDAIEEIVAAEERLALARAIDELPAGAREVVVLYYREGRSSAHVADLLGMSEDAVKKRLSRARAQLREALAQQLVETAPGAAFTLAVLTGISLAAPPAAAAATIGATKAVAAGKIGANLTGGGLLSGAVAGAASGLGSSTIAILFTARQSLRAARDEEERRGVIQASITKFLAVLTFIVVVIRWPTPLPVTIAYAIAAFVFVFCHLIWEPRITRRRHAAELMEDPVGAATRHRKQSRQAVWSCVIGIGLGGAAVMSSWFV